MNQHMARKVMSHCKHHTTVASEGPCKSPSWRYNTTDDHRHMQIRTLELSSRWVGSSGVSNTSVSWLRELILVNGSGTEICQKKKRRANHTVGFKVYMTRRQRERKRLQERRNTTINDSFHRCIGWFQVHDGAATRREEQVKVH